MLAGTTSFLLLLVFATVNLSLVAIKYRERHEKGARYFGLIVPLAAAATSLALMLALPPESILRGGSIVLLGMLLVAVRWCMRV